MHGQGGVGNDLSLGGGGMGAKNPAALEMVLWGGDAGGSAVSGVVEPAVLTEVDAAVNLAGGVVTGGKLEDLAQIGKDADFPGRRIVFVQEGISLGALVIADGGIVFAADTEAFAPDRPRVAGVVLTGVVEKVNAGSGLGDLNARAKIGAGFHQRGGRATVNGFTTGELGRPTEILRGHGEVQGDEERDEGFHERAFHFSSITMR